jgi:tRNA pseudouridine55 synthase
MHGVLNLDKPGGLTSRQAVSRVKRELRVKKAGHAGTLDPMATGVLLVCIGEATKISSLLMDMPKTYEAELRLGQRTDTLDADGPIIEEREVSEIPGDAIGAALDSFRGLIRQTPPMYSAIKKDGRPLYELAREGRTVKRKEREVTIYEIECTGYQHPFLRIRVGCSRGTYIRTLAEDIAGRLGTVAHLSALRRTRVGLFNVEDASSLERADAWQGDMVSIDRALVSIKEVVLGEEDFVRMQSGGFVNPEKYGMAGPAPALRLKSPRGELFAVGSSDRRRIKVERILHLKGQT